MVIDLIILQSLRDKQKAIKESHGPSMKQMKMWKDFQTLMECKRDCHLNIGQADSSKMLRDEANQEDRLIL